MIRIYYAVVHPRHAEDRSAAPHLYASDLKARQAILRMPPWDVKLCVIRAVAISIPRKNK